MGAQPILVVPWVTSEKLRPEPLPFLPAGLYDTYPSRGTADPHRCMWVLSEVDPPGGMAILPGVRGYDYEPVAVLEVGEGDWSRLSAATTRGDQEQDWRFQMISMNLVRLTAGMPLLLSVWAALHRPYVGLEGD